MTSQMKLRHYLRLQSLLENAIIPYGSIPYGQYKERNWNPEIRPLSRMKTKFLYIIPVLPSSDIERDVAWYKERAGFGIFFADKMYASLHRENLCIHLQWHADTASDPLLGGSVIRIFVKDIKPLFDEFVRRGTVAQDSFKSNTPWNTNEFGFFDLNKNAIFIAEDIEAS